jgi:hypothetical protein
MVLEQCVGYLTYIGTQPLCLRKPSVLQHSISDCDSDYAKDENNRRSVSGRINMMGGMTTNWTSKKQKTMSLSSSEAISERASISIHSEVGTGANRRKKPAITYEDNIGTIVLVKNQHISSRTKHTLISDITL